MKYLDSNKKTTTKDDAKFVYIENGIVLKRKNKEAIQLPLFDIIGEFGDKAAITTDKDTLLTYLKKNIKPNWWKLIGREIDNSCMIKIGEHKNKKYELEERKVNLKQKDLRALATGLSLLSKDLQFSDILTEKKDIINSILKPSDLADIDAYTELFEQGKLFISDELGVILDISVTKGNISGNVFDSLYRYVGQNIHKLNQILARLGVEGTEEVDIFYMYKISENAKIEFRKDGVYLIKSSGDAEVEQVMLDTPIQLVGWYQSNYNILTGATTKQIEKFYIMKTGENLDKEVVFPYFNNTDKFNKWLGGIGIRMLVTGKNYQLFYSALDQWIKDEQMSEIEVVQYNGIDLDKKIFTHGGDTIFSETENNYKVFAPRYATIEGEQITLKEAVEILRGYNKVNYQYIILLWFIGALLKKDFMNHGIYTPLLQVIGFSESGKTEIVQLIMKLFGYSTRPIRDGNEVLDPRMATLEGTTKFAVQKMLGDYSPIFFDEFTGKVDKSIEELFRGIFNEKKAEKGNADQSTTVYNLLSPVVIGGERAPEYNSVLNRSIYLQLDNSMKTTSKRYNEIKKNVEGKVVLEDVWNKVKNADLSKYKNWFDDVEGRVEANYMFLRVVNDIVGLFEARELEEMLRQPYELQQSILTGKDELRVFFNNILVLGKREQNISVTYTREEELLLDIYVPEELSTKSHAILAIKQLVGDENGDLTNIQINVTKMFKEKNKKSEWIIQALFRHLRNYRNKTWQSFLLDYAM